MEYNNLINSIQRVNNWQIKIDNNVL